MKPVDSRAANRLPIWTAVIAFALLLFGSVPSARAVPAFARQTGQRCIACHVSFPELTPYGRYFKLTGYTIEAINRLTSNIYAIIPMRVKKT
jgi:hypothetical protein